jgi:hypothetical protein
MNDFLFWVAAYFSIGALLIFLIKFKKLLFPANEIKKGNSGAQSIERVGLPAMVVAVLIVVALWPAFIVLIFASWLSLLISWPNGGFEWSEIGDSITSKHAHRAKPKLNKPLKIVAFITSFGLISAFFFGDVVLTKMPSLGTDDAAVTLPQHGPPGASCSAVWLSSMSEVELCDAYWKKASPQCDQKMARELIERGVSVTPRSSCGNRSSQPMPDSASIIPGSSCSSNWISSLSNEEICKSYWENTHAQCNKKLAVEIAARGLTLSPRASCGVRR